MIVCFLLSYFYSGMMCLLSNKNKQKLSAFVSVNELPRADICVTYLRVSLGGSIAAKMQGRI